MATRFLGGFGRVPPSAEMRRSAGYFEPLGRARTTSSSPHWTGRGSIRRREGALTQYSNDSPPDVTLLEEYRAQLRKELVAIEAQISQLKPVPRCDRVETPKPGVRL